KTVSERYVFYAKRVLEGGIPELIEAVRQGKLTPSKAALMAHPYTRMEQQELLAQAGGDVVKAVGRLTSEKFGGARSKPAQSATPVSIKLPPDNPNKRE